MHPRILHGTGAAATTASRPVSRSKTNNNSFKRNSPTFWIGISMFCLVILYVVVVIFVARIHLQNTVASTATTTTTTTSIMANQLYDELKLGDSIQQKVQERLNQKSRKQQQQQSRKNNHDNSNHNNIPQVKSEQEQIDQMMKQLDQVLDPVLNEKKDDDDDEEEKEHNKNKDKEKEEQQADQQKPKPQHQPKQDNNNNNNKHDEPVSEKNRVREIFGHGVQPQELVKPVQQDLGGLQLTASTAADDAVLSSTHPTPQYILKAYIETVDFDEWEQKPLPVRKQASESKLQQVSYPRLQSCRNFIAQFPVDDTPTNQDPFLPWIHDVFPTADGKFIQFVAQNKRRCKTGTTQEEQDILMFMQPQAALFQHVPIKRVDNDRRYQLVPYEQADPDGMVTRFICRFKPSMEETLSVFNLDYDWTSLRKRYKQGFDQKDGGIKSIHTTQLLFKCPVPEHLQETIRTGAAVQNDWTSLFVDIIPIRTPPRYGSPNRYLAPWYQEGNQARGVEAFQPLEEWGDAHILPRIEDSGRWENIPICKPSLMEWEGATVADLPATKEEPMPKKHHLVSCLWVSAGYATRGNRFAINDGQRRLLEWITHNKNIGFDHFYIYDNTGAFRNDTSLKPIADLFPEETTWIPWPSKVCNNNPNNVDSPGERSSQYAAESSCRLRFGQHVEWIGQFDIDEYLIPMGDHKTATSLLAKLDEENTKIISFPSWRAWPRWAHIDPIERIEDKSVCWSNEPCFHLTIPLSTTMLQAYNCDRQLPGKKSQVMPAEKQIYKADYVIQHFVHYSAATVLSELNQTEYEKQFPWTHRGFPDKRQRFANEVTEGLMIHTKAVATQDTVGWERVCHLDNLKQPYRKRGLCRLGVPWPADPGLIKQNGTEEGWAYNCYVNRKVEEYFVPHLDAALKKHMDFFTAPQ